MPQGYDHNNAGGNDSWWEGDDGCGDDDQSSSSSSSGWGNEMRAHGGPSVDLVSETTGEAIPLRLMTPSRGGFHDRDDDDEGRGFGSSPMNNNDNGILALGTTPEDGAPRPRVEGLLCGDVRVPDIYTLRVGGNGTTRYRQANWIEPFELTYLGPMLMTVEVRKDTIVCYFMMKVSNLCKKTPATYFKQF